MNKLKQKTEAASDKLKDAKESVDTSHKVSELWEKFLKDFTNLSAKDRIKRIGEIIFVATIGKLFGIKKKAEETAVRGSVIDPEAQTRGEEPSGSRREEETSAEPAPPVPRGVAGKPAKGKALPTGQAGTKDSTDLEEPVEEDIPKETAEMRKRLIERAYYYLNKNPWYFQKKYYETNNIYRGGRLGCAVTVSTILKESGNINIKAPFPGVNATEAKLREDGWIETRWRPGLPQAGDVIVWRRWHRGREKRHIGIVVGPNQVIHNVFKNGKARPQLTPIRRTQFATIWQPPSSVMPGVERLRRPAKRPRGRPIGGKAVQKAA